MTDAPYELFAVRYATIAREARDNVVRPLRSASGSRRPGEMDYFVWVARSGGRTIVVDTGFAPEDAAPRGRTALRTVREGLAAIDVDPASVSDVVLTHLHNDHSGGTALFPEATFHVQQRELAYASGPAMRHELLHGGYDPGDVADVLALARSGRVRFLDGDTCVAAGVRTHLVGGHTPGTQIVSVATSRGDVVLASDAVHFFDNLTDRNPFPILHDTVAVLDAFETIVELAPGPEAIVPGHDPEVRLRYPAPADDLADWVVRLDHDPLPEV